ncbi:hypothetical protein SAMN02910357_02022 [Succinivibrio dextrinosolvens]|uniref:hypothetical protein n=1 Tax=Succinivibrio dextrinosolvens TaxID=83771 RepID=UPI0008EDAF6E|nr:hypothetical protein [Succinivibrio dextrinosolvens]SFS82012.1 hypothetical protein SAMN02910357_02022 [Succinivibrio dextrinosolvens]
MNNLSNALPIMVNNYAKLFGVSVRIQGSTAYTNGKVITIPRLDIKNPIKARLAYGYLAHESAHIRYTDFSILKKDKIKNNLFLFSLFNILEDSRIEALISKEYIGVYENLELLSDYYMDEWKSFCNTLNSISVLNVICAFVQCYSQCLCQKFRAARSKSAILYFHLRKRLNIHLLNKIGLLVKECSKADDSETVYKICLKIFSLLKNDKSGFKGEDRSLNNSGDNDERFRNIMDESKKNFNKSKDKISEDFLREFAKFRIATGDDDSKVTPSRNGAEIIQENSNSKSSSSREDFGVIAENICNPGREDFILQVNNTYGVRNALHNRVRAYVDSLGNCTAAGSRINPLKAQLISLGETRIFKDRIVKKEFETAVHILVDVSSSMLTSDGGENSRCEEACKVALTLSLALEGIDGIKTMATYFPGQCSEYDVALKSDERASMVAPRFDQKPRGSTPLAQALWYSFDKFQEIGYRRNIVLVITDGMPDSVNNVKNCFEYAKEHHIEIYGISIRSDMILKLFEKASIIESTNELEHKAFSLFSSLFDLKKNLQFAV